MCPGPPGLSSGRKSCQKLKCKTRAKEGFQRKWRRCSLELAPAVRPCASRVLTVRTCFYPTDSSLFRGHQGLQASQDPLGSLQW